MEKNFDRDDHQITIPIQIGESLVEKIFDDHQVTIQTEEPLMEELLDTDSEETEDPFELGESQILRNIILLETDPPSPQRKTFKF